MKSTLNNLIFNILYIIGLLFLLGCSVNKHAKSSTEKDNWNDSTTVLLIDKMRKKPSGGYIFEKLNSTETNYSVKKAIDIQRVKILSVYGNEFLKSDTIIIVESYIELGSSYNFVVYTSQDKKIRKFYDETEIDGLVHLKESCIKQNEEINYVLNGKLEEFIKENRKYKMSPQTEYIISVFTRIYKNDYNFYSVRTTR